MKKTILLATIFAMLLTSVFVSCTQKPDDDLTKSTSDASTAEQTDKETDSLEARKNMSDNLPQKNFEGKEFIILTDTNLVQDIKSETENGEIINDAIYSRNRNVEERFNVKIMTIAQIWDQTTVFAQKSILSGDETFHLEVSHVVQLSGLLLQDLFMNWYDIPNIDFSQPWWSRSTTLDLTYGGDKAILAVGDLALSSLYKTYCYFYDKNLAENYGINDIYKTVENGSWTLDKVTSYTKDIYEDINGDSKRDDGDFYGLVHDSHSGINAYLWAFDNPVMKSGSDGKPELVLKTDRINSICDNLYSFLYENTGTYANWDYTGTSGSSHYIARDFFSEGRAMFINGYLDYTVSHFRFNETDYGIIPYPKFDEEQSEYKTMVGGGHAALAVPKTTKDPEFVGIITEALNAESYKTVVPSYYDIALKVKFARDSESVALLDLIIDSRVFDFGYVYDNWKGLSFFPEFMLGKDKSKDFESYYAANSGKAIDYYNKVTEYFENME